jgi:hypothetical protein
MSQELSTYKRYKKSYDAHHKKYVATHRDRLNKLQRERYASDTAYREMKKRVNDRYRKENRAICNERLRNWKRRNPEKIRGYEVKRLYGLNPSEYEALLKKQDNKCAICEAELVKKPRWIHVDHCHDTDTVRGVLCNDCNLRIGWWEFFEARPEYKDKIVSYLEKHRNG